MVGEMISPSTDLDLNNHIFICLIYLFLGRCKTAGIPLTKRVLRYLILLFSLNIFWFHRPNLFFRLILVRKGSRLLAINAKNKVLVLVICPLNNISHSL